MKTISYICNTYIADGQRVSSTTHYATPEAAMRRAEAWRKVNTKANAFRVEIDTKTLETRVYPLD